MKTSFGAILICMGLLVPGVNLGAGEDVDFWFAKMKANLDKAYYTDVEGEIQLIQQGQMVKVHLKGRIIYKDPKHARFKMTMSMKIENNPITLDLLTVYDGIQVWLETRSSLMPEILVDMADFSSDEVASEWMNLADWPTILEEFQQLSQLVVIEKANGQVILEGLLSEEELKALGLISAGRNKEPWVYRIVLDEETAFPMVILKGLSASPVLHLRFNDFQLLPTSDLPDDAFQYKPPATAIIREH